MKSIQSARSGIAIIPVIAFYAVAMTLLAIWAKGLLREHRQVGRWHERTQTSRCAEAGLQRAIARLAKPEADYTGESWRIEARDSGSPHETLVEIRVEPLAEASQFHIVAVADYPAGADRRVRLTRSLDFDLTTLRPLSAGE